jgi:exodeoxyribonuclease III
MPLNIISWNVNGLRAVYKKGFLDWVSTAGPDILCLQETKAEKEQLPLPLREIEGYHAYFSSARRRGYSGVAVYSRRPPDEIGRGFGMDRFDGEGRILVARYPSFVLLNIYFPNGKASQERLDYKMAFYDACLDYLDRLVAGGLSPIVCGDVNTAHRTIDLARPRENETVSGFLPIERAWIDKLIDRGYLDTLRMFDPLPGRYTWWDYKSGARERNVGWRIDYFYVHQSIANRVESAFILSDVMGSDHCPIGITIRE